MNEKENLTFNEGNYLTKSLLGIWHLENEEDAKEKTE